MLRTRTLANMRDHLPALAGIRASWRGAYDRVSDTVEPRLGMSSLGLHGAHDGAKFMAQGMQAAGAAMRRRASQFAILAKDASVTGDLKGIVHDLLGGWRPAFSPYSAGLNRRVRAGKTLSRFG